MGINFVNNKYRDNLMIKDIKIGKKIKREYQNIVYDSLEEVYIRWYLDELLEAGIIRDVVYQPETILLSDPKKYWWEEELKTKSNQKSTKFLEGSTYTYDFEWQWDDKYHNIFAMDIDHPPSFKKGEKKPYFLTQCFLTQWACSSIDVKGKFANRGSNLREFEAKRKWLYQKTGVFVQKIIPEKLFEATFTPSRYLFCDKMIKKLRTIHFEAKTLDLFLNRKQENTH